MPYPSHTASAHPAEHLTTIGTSIVGNEWTPPVTFDWPLTFINEIADRELTLYPDRRNNRLVFVLGLAGSDADRRRYAKYTADITGHDGLDDWLARSDLTAVSDALAVIVLRLIGQPLPAPAVQDADPAEQELEQLAAHARELAKLTAQFAAGLIRREPVTDAARRIVTLAQETEQTATRVDELRGPTRAPR